MMNELGYSILGYELSDETAHTIYLFLNDLVLLFEAQHIERIKRHALSLHQQAEYPEQIYPDDDAADPF